MLKKLCVLSNICLLVWFFFDMFGLSIGSLNLVESAWKSIDGIWFLTYSILLILFFTKETYGKYLLTAFIILWGIIQFYSHWHYTIFGASQSKIDGYNHFFKNTYHVFPASNTIIVPDLYHIILHILIMFAAICMIKFCIRRTGYLKFKKIN